MSKLKKIDFVYVSRRYVDFEYNLPLIENCNCIVFKTSLESYQKISNTVELYELNFFLKIGIKLNKKLKKFKHLRGVVKKLDDIIHSKILNQIKSISSNVGCRKIVFDHNFSTSYVSLFNLLSKAGFRLYSIPHGENPFENKLLDDHDIQPQVAVYVDQVIKVIGTSIGHRNFIGGELINLDSLRYTRFWVQKQIKLLENNPNQQHKYAILVLHSLSTSGVSLAQVNRTLKFLNTLNVPILLRPHPKNGIKELRDIKKYKNIFISNKSILEDTVSSDIVVHFQSSGYMDAIVLEKKVVFAQFATANRIHASYLRNQITCETFDKFYATIDELLNSKKGNIEDNKLDSMYDLKNFQSRLADWKKELDLI